MEQDAATLYCPNEICQAANPLNNNYCQRCSTPLPKRYLWAVTEGKSLGNPGAILADRYLIISQFVLLDTKPGLVPQVPTLDNLQKLRPYLRLFPYRLNVPQVYGVVSNADETQLDILLLEKPPVRLENPHTPTEVKLEDALDFVWSQATSIRQLNWLWQIAHIWQPLASEGVASSLLDPLLLRPEGSLIKILELREDSEVSPSLGDLGDFWRTNLLPNTAGALKEFFAIVCESLVSGEIHSGEQLVAVLDQGLLSCLSSPNKDSLISVKIVTNTDTGPSRQRNEDSCYPAAGSIVSKPPSPTATAIVCDGIGGHEGGNVASNIAIDVIQQQVSQLASVPRDRIDPVVLLADLEKAAATANDKISQRNDSEGRQGRQRMGTTLVMALPIAHEMYITHVGDSRAYLITRAGCYQVTLDDDVASREVRLGYAVYRDAIMQGASGSLVQALGMGSSNSLHPTAQRFVLDEDCVFLLCSDGLSDFDRVEQHWETEILPILTDGMDITEAVDNLIQIANKYNGHDNVTVALVHYQIKYSEPEKIQAPNIADLSNNYGSNNNLTTNATTKFVSPNQKTQVIPDTALPKKKIHLPLIVLFSVVALGIIIGLFLTRSAQQGKIILPTLPSRAPTPPPQLKLDISVGSVVNITTSQIEFSDSDTYIQKGNIPLGTTLKVIESKPINERNVQSELLHMEVCQVPKEAPRVVPSVKIEPGKKIWIKKDQLQTGWFSEAAGCDGVETTKKSPTGNTEKSPQQGESEPESNP